MDSMIPGRETTTLAVFGYTNTAGTNPVQSYVVTTQANTIIPDSPVKLRRVWDTWSGNVLAGPSGTTENFIRIGRLAAGPAAALVGGHLSRYLYRIGQRREASVLSPSDSFDFSLRRNMSQAAILIGPPSIQRASAPVGLA